MNHSVLFYAELGDDWYNGHRRRGQSPFYAIKVKGVLHPCTYGVHEPQKKYEAFIRGTGRKSSKTGHLIPPLSTGASVSEFQAYFDKYGPFCTYFAVYGRDLDDFDCCYDRQRQEFKAGMAVGWDYLAEFNSRIHSVNAEIQRITLEKWGVDPMAKNVRDGLWTNKYGKLQFKPLFYVRPVHSLMFYFLCAPHVDVIQDDERLCNTWFYLTYNGEESEPGFPVSVKDRLTFLYSPGVSEQYEYLLTHYPMSYRRD